MSVSRRKSWSIESLVRLSLRNPRAVLAVWLSVGFAFSLLMVDLSIDTTIGSALDRSGAPWELYERSLDLYGGDEFVSVALAQSGEPYGTRVLRDIIRLTDSLESVSGVRRVDSLASVPMIRTDPDGSLLVTPALTKSFLDSPESGKRLQGFVSRDLVSPGSLVSQNGRTFAINVVFDDDVDGDRETSVGEIREILTEYPGAVMSGVPVVRAEAGRLTRSEIVRLVPITVLVIGVFLVVVFGQLRAVILPLLVGAISSVVCLGTMAWMLVPLSFSTAVLPSVILALACAYSMHFLTLSVGDSGGIDMVSDIANVGRPVALSGATTSLGFLAMSTNEVQLISHLAIYGALGAIVCTLACLTIGPACAEIWPLRADASHFRRVLFGRSAGQRISVFVLERRRTIVIVWGLALATAIGGLTRLTVSSDVINWFPENGELRESYRGIREHLSGITPVSVLITPPNDESAVSPRMLATIAEFSDALNELPYVGKTLAVSDPVRLVHRELAGADLGDLPTDENLISQYMLLLGAVEQMDDVVTRDYESANVLVRLDDNSSVSIAGFSAWSHSWWESNGPADSSVGVTGIMFEFARAQDAISRGGVLGLLIALGAVGVLVVAFFREGWLSLITMIANATPVLSILGVIGWMSMPLDAATVCVASLSIGIAVDDSIHVVSGYQNAAQGGAAIRSAIERALSRVFPALLLTTLAIFIGFGVLGSSAIGLVANLGVTMCASVAVCLLADVTLLPALLSLREKTGRN